MMSEPAAEPAPVAHARLANALRFLAADAVQRANSGHPGMPMGIADAATVLFHEFLRFDAGDPEWPDRDRFVLSAGHGSMLLYGALHLLGYDDVTMDQLRSFRQLGSCTPGHPEYGRTRGVETTTGPLGQGLANAVGMALAERLLAERFGGELVDHRTWVIAGDGDLMEGMSHEAASLAGHLALEKLIVLLDDNSVSIDGPTGLATSDDVIGRFESYGWLAARVDGHDPEALRTAFAEAGAADRPVLLACRTRIGYGAPTKAGSAASHGAPLGEVEIAGARESLGWPYPAFEVPDDVLASWRAAGVRGRAQRLAWRQRLARAPEREAFERALAGDFTAGWSVGLQAMKAKVLAEQPKIATRVASQWALEPLVSTIPELVGGSADLSGSNNTKVKGLDVVRARGGGRYIHYGVREHAMAAAMNGLALHKGVVPYGGTFLVFSDYARPAIRLAALMRLRVVHVMTHDSIGLGEDGPTHQPVEQLAGLRAIPNLLVFRPADAIETAECWELALENRDGPSVLSLTRQGVPTVREEATANLSARGAYLLAEPAAPRALTLLATGSEVSVALDARARLDELGIPTAVVSMPCWELFERQSAAYRAEVLGAAPRLAVEAASPFGWTRYVASEDDVVAMTGFGASAPAPALFEHFGLTPERVVERGRALAI
jgi:transketolase